MAYLQGIQMKAIVMIRAGEPCNVVELGLKDIVRLLLGREIIAAPMAIRIQWCYEMFNLGATT